MNKITAPSTNYTQTIKSDYIALEEIQENTHFIDCEIDCHFGRSQLQEVQFENCRFLTDDFSEMEFLDTIFKKCDLSNCNFNKSIFYRCQFDTCKLIGTEFIRDTFKNVQWQNCLMNYTSFSESKMKYTYFEDNQLEEAFFQDVDFDHIEFLHCNLQLADLTESVLKGVDISTCDFTEIKLTPNLAKGLSIRFDQAASIAAMLGVVIKN